MVMLDHTGCIERTTFVCGQNFDRLYDTFFVCLPYGLLDHLIYKFIALFSMLNYMLHLGFSLLHCTD